MKKSQKTMTNMTAEEIKAEATDVINQLHDIMDRYHNEFVEQSNRLALDDLISSGKAIEEFGIICTPRLKADLAYGFYEDDVDIPIIADPCVESNKCYVVTDTELVNRMKEMVGK